MLLRYKEDRRSLAFVISVFAAELLCLRLNVASMSWTGIIFSALVLGWGCYLCQCINHNFIHVPFFVKKEHNKIFGTFLGMTQAASPTSLIVTHNLKHHKHLARETDWFHHSKAGVGFGFMRLIRYVGATWAIIGKERKTDETVKLNAHQAKQEKMENIAILLYFILCLAINWKAFLLIIFPAMLSASLGITAINLLQHDGCEFTEHAHSHNYTSNFGNWFFFNGGYHGIHHDKPSVHWSELPKYHEAIADKIPAHLNSSSLIMTVLQKYSFNRS